MPFKLFSEQVLDFSLGQITNKRRQVVVAGTKGVLSSTYFFVLYLRTQIRVQDVFSLRASQSMSLKVVVLLLLLVNLVVVSVSVVILCKNVSFQTY